MPNNILTNISARFKDIKYSCKYVFLVRTIILLVFGASFVGKILSMEDFVNIIVEFTDIEMNYAIMFADTILAAELYIIVQIIFESNYKRIMLQTIIFLGAFTAALIYILLSSNTNNCFCFGHIMPFGAVESIIKNIIIISMLYYCIKPICRKDKLVTIADGIKILLTAVAFIAVMPNPKNIVSVDIKEITVSEMIQIKDNRDVVVIDSRSRNAYSKDHIEGAVNVPYTGQAIKYLNIENEDRYNTMIVYCDSKLCSLSRIMVKALKSKYPNKNIYSLVGGLEEWQNISK